MRVSEETAIAQKIFVRAADDDYLAARAMLELGLFRHFAWNACQTIEKYSKCSLLINSNAKISFTHDVKDLVSRLREHTHDLIPESFNIPEEIISERFREVHLVSQDGPNETVENYLQRLNIHGSTDTRYRQVPLRFLPLDLVKFDILSFMLRRVCIPLNATNSNGTTYLEVLRRDRNFDASTEFAFLRQKKSLYDAKRSEILSKNNFKLNSDNFNFSQLPASMDRSEIASAAMATSDFTSLRSFLESRFKTSERILKGFDEALKEHDR
ncbi:HEPN domain-containing protein [Epibacterium sp. SM1969]|uniref:HEPN domain-containing protein n=1 Tax=Tritonibacter aquimaris TaxID=2663379 RepID=A0A844APX7_9RHOB|nr:HEPN domain-containing protein [Tritonibacter aquimaris]MQY42863.1 HEPN domain-containing protein [Tritonibacter aquimaris]